MNDEFVWSAEFLDAAEFAGLATRAFGASPLGDVTGARTVIANYEFFRSQPGATAVSARTEDGAVAGFACGYPDFHWADGEWDDLVREALGAAAVRLVARFRVAFLAVGPEEQGFGLGRSLLRAVVPAGTAAAWLVTRDAATAAQGLFASEGWREIGRGPIVGPGQRGAVLWKEFPTD